MGNVLILVLYNISKITTLCIKYILNKLAIGWRTLWDTWQTRQSIMAKT
jgi:hypothetical protein